MDKTYSLWVHGNSGQIEVVTADWGTAEAKGWGFVLNGKAKVTPVPQSNPLTVDTRIKEHGEPWIHFHLPMRGYYLEPNSRYKPKAARLHPLLRKVMVRFSTDNEPPINETGGNDDNNVGGAILSSIHVWDANNHRFEQNDLPWQTSAADDFQEKEIILPDIEIAGGLDIVLRFRFKYQLSTSDNDGNPSVPYVPSWSNPVKHAVIAAVGCVFLPAST
jgi:hypothetical protein